MAEHGMATKTKCMWNRGMTGNQNINKVTGKQVRQKQNRTGRDETERTVTNICILLTVVSLAVGTQTHSLLIAGRTA